MTPFWFCKYGWVVCLALYSQPSSAAQCADKPPVSELQNAETLWQDDFRNGFQSWGELKFQFGVENISFVSEADILFPKFLRVHYPRGSYDPGSAQRGLAPLGGVQFTSRFESMKVPLSDAIVLSYAVRFDPEFDFVRGGKLPGLYGGIPKSGGHIPNGSDGFSTRAVWLENGKGAIYAYLPTSLGMTKEGQKIGSLIGKGDWQFPVGKWMVVSHLVKLNEPDVDDGRITIWIDGVLVHDECELRFRDVPTLKINGIFFSTFFGGNDPSWATLKDTYADFTNFRLSRVKR